MIDSALFVVYAVTSVVSMMLIKLWLPAAQIAWQSGASVDRAGILVILGAGLYVVSFSLWMAILSRNQLSIAFPTAIGLTLILSTIGAFFVLDEPVAVSRLVGIALIMAGLFFVVRS